MLLLYEVYEILAENNLNSNLTASDELQFRFATDGVGNYGYLKADDSFIPFKGNVTIKVQGISWIVTGGRVMALSIYVNDEKVLEETSPTFSNSGVCSFTSSEYKL